MGEKDILKTIQLLPGVQSGAKEALVFMLEEEVPIKI